MIDITRLKILLNIEDDSEDDLLVILKEHSQWKIKAYLQIDQEEEFPMILDWVADEVTAKRYNKLSAEGLLSEGISGVTHTFEEDFLKEFIPVLDNYIRHMKPTTKKGRLVML